MLVHSITDIEFLFKSSAISSENLLNVAYHTLSETLLSCKNIISAGANGGPRSRV